MFQLSLFTEFGRLCNPFDYVLGFTFLLMAFTCSSCSSICGSGSG